MPQDDLAVRPGQLEDAIGQPRVVVFLHQAPGRLARLGDAGDDVDAGRFIRRELDGAADGDDRVEHRPFAVGQRPASCIASRIGRCRPRPMNAAVGLEDASPTVWPCTVIR